MTYIEKEGKVYEVIEQEINIEQEEYKLQAWKDALVSDARELAEYQEKISNIEALDIPEDLKNKLKESVVFSSPSGVTQEMVNEQETKVNALNNI